MHYVLEAVLKLRFNCLFTQNKESGTPQGYFIYLHKTKRLLYYEDTSLIQEKQLQRKSK
jgi:hypothetical protein